MSFFEKDEFKIFLTFFIIYALLVHWADWDNESRLALSKAIAMENRLEIDSYVNFTGDRSVYNGHYYSSKAPGLSMLAVPEVVFFDLLVDEDIDNDKTIFNITDLTPNELILRIIFSVTFSALPGSLLILLIYRMTNYILSENYKRLIVACSFGFGTILFAYGTSSFGYATASFLGFLGFSYIFRTSRNELPIRFWFISGVLLGFAIVVEYLMVPIVMGVICYILLLKIKKRYMAQILFGCFIGLLPLLIYNFLIFSNPLEFTSLHLDPEIFVCPSKLEYCQPIGLDDVIFDAVTFPIGVFNALFSPYKGILFYSPILILSILGIPYLKKQHKYLAVFTTFILVLFLCFINFYSVWTGGASFGLRFMVPLIPFLSIPFSVSLEKFWKARFFRLIFVMLLSVSIFHMLLGFSASWEGLGYLYFKGQNVKEIFNLNWGNRSIETDYYGAILSNPLYDYYLPEFIKNGVRSRILEYVLIKKTPDIRSITLIPLKKIKLLTTSFGFITIDVTFIIIPIIFALISILWKDRWYSTKSRKYSLIVLSVILIALILTRIGTSNLVYNEDWYPTVEESETKWMERNGSVYIYSDESEKKILNLSLENYKTEKVSIYFNGMYVNTYNNQSYVLEDLNFKKGENILYLNSSDDCHIPLEEENQIKCTTMLECFDMKLSPYNMSYDPRCITYGIANIEVFDYSVLGKLNDSIVFGNGMKELEESKGMDYRWVGDTGKIYFTSTSDSFSILKLRTWTHTEDRAAEFYINGNKLSTETISIEDSEVVLPAVYLDEGLYTLEVVSQCDYPENEARCISIAISNLTIETYTPMEILEAGFGSSGWFVMENDSEKEFRWMTDKATIKFYKFGVDLDRDMKFSIESYWKPRDLIIRLNGNSIKTAKIYEERNLSSKLILLQGYNEIEFLSKEGCDIPFEKEGINDRRCLSFSIHGLEF